MQMPSSVGVIVPWMVLGRPDLTSNRWLKSAPASTVIVRSYGSRPELWTSITSRMPCPTDRRLITSTGSGRPPGSWTRATKTALKGVGVVAASGRSSRSVRRSDQTSRYRRSSWIRPCTAPRVMSPLVSQIAKSRPETSVIAPVPTAGTVQSSAFIGSVMGLTPGSAVRQARDDRCLRPPAGRGRRRRGVPPSCRR